MNEFLEFQYDYRKIYEVSFVKDDDDKILTYALKL